MLPNLKAYWELGSIFVRIIELYCLGSEYAAGFVWDRSLEFSLASRIALDNHVPGE